MTTQQKPRLILVRGLWHCGILNIGRWQYLGCGRWPGEAYEDWKKGGAQ